MNEVSHQPKSIYFIGLLFLLLMSYGVSMPSTAQSESASSDSEIGFDSESDAVPVWVVSNIEQRLGLARPDISVDNIRPSPIAGIYKVDLNGDLAFVSEDGQFLIAGEMYQASPGRLVNLQEEERQQQEAGFAPQRAQLLAAVNKDDMVIYSPKEVKGHVYVFTDIDCGFCRRLHSQMADMLDMGIEVRYLAFPRAGINSRSAQKLATTWCSEDPKKMMTQYKRGDEVALAVCDGNPVADQYILGQEVGVRGTPAIVLESGIMIPGAVSPETLATQMGI